MAREEVRHPREQLRYLLREEAQRRGLLTPERSEQAEQEAHNAAHNEE
jgi:hypothetical protein